nr:hypothetical protein [Tanacetum cinerariifolium]
MLVPILAKALQEKVLLKFGIPTNTSTRGFEGRYGDCRTGSRGENMVICPHGFIIGISHGIVKFKKVEKEWEMGDIKDR